jgi:hypothetical protein
MARDWTCARCGAASPEGVHACQACGLLRGSVVPEPNPVTSAAATPGAVPVPPPVPAVTADSALVPAWSDASAGGPTAAPVRSRRRLVLGLLVAVVLVGGGAAFNWFSNVGRSSTGEINKAGQLAVSDLRPGDCYDLPGDTASFDPAASGDRAIRVAQAKPCTEPHPYEVFYAGTIDSATYPTDTELRAWTESNCGPAFDAYIGKAYADSVLDVYTNFPSEAGWTKGSRDMQCSVADPLLKPLTSSLKGSQR